MKEDKFAKGQKPRFEGQKSLFGGEPPPPKEYERFVLLRVFCYSEFTVSACVDGSITEETAGGSASYYESMAHYLADTPNRIVRALQDLPADTNEVIKDMQDALGVGESMEPSIEPSGEETPAERRERLLAIHYGDDDWHELDAQDKADRDRFISQLDIFAHDFDKRFFKERARINVELGKKIKL